VTGYTPGSRTKDSLASAEAENFSSFLLFARTEIASWPPKELTHSAVDAGRSIGTTPTSPTIIPGAGTNASRRAGSDLSGLRPKLSAQFFHLV
jgi:hypothetical protein